MTNCKKINIFFESQINKKIFKISAGESNGNVVCYYEVCENRNASLVQLSDS